MIPSRTFGVQELDHHVVLEDVDLFYRGDDVHPDSLQGALKPFVVRGSGLVDRLLLSAEIQSTKLNQAVHSDSKTRRTRLPSCCTSKKNMWIGKKLETHFTVVFKEKKEIIIFYYGPHSGKRNLRGSL